MSNTLSLGRRQTEDPNTLCPLLGGSFIFLDDGSFQFFPCIPPFFGCFGLFTVARFHHTRLSIPFFSSCVFQIKVGPLLGNVFMSANPVPSSPTCQTGYLGQIFCLWICPTEAPTMQIRYGW
jgi:hypothetical protein